MSGSYIQPFHQRRSLSANESNAISPLSLSHFDISYTSEIPQTKGKIYLINKFILRFRNCEELVKLLTNIGLNSKLFKVQRLH